MDAAIDKVSQLKEFSIDDDALWQRCLHLPQGLLNLRGECPRVGVRLFGDRKHNARHAVDRAVTSLCLRPDGHPRHLLEEHRPHVAGLHGHLSKIFQHRCRIGAQAAQNPDGPLALPLDRKAAAGVDVAFGECPLHVLKRHAVFQEGHWLDLDLILLAFSTLHKHLSHARNFFQTRPHHPVGERSQINLLGTLLRGYCLGIWLLRCVAARWLCAGPAAHAGDHDLSHDRRSGRHLWANALGQRAGERGKAFLHRLSRG